MYCVASDLLCAMWQVIVVDYVAASPTHFPKPHLLFQAPPTFPIPPPSNYNSVVTLALLTLHTCTSQPSHLPRTRRRHTEVQCGRGLSHLPARHLPSSLEQPSPTPHSHMSPLTLCMCTVSHHRQSARSLLQHSHRSWATLSHLGSTPTVVLGMVVSS